MLDLADLKSLHLNALEINAVPLSFFVDFFHLTDRPRSRYHRLHNFFGEFPWAQAFLLPAPAKPAMNMTTPKVLLFRRCDQNGRAIEQTMRSVLAQTFLQVEFWIAAHCSTDGHLASSR